MKKEANVHRLPTEKGTIATYKKTGNLAKPNFRIGIFESDIYQPQHLYVTTDEKPNKGEWCYAPSLDRVFQITSDAPLPNEARKIIATTDPKLTKRQNWVEAEVQGHHECTNCGEWTEVLPMKCKCNPIDKIHQSFIEEYCKAGGIDKVLVEYELGYHDPDYRCNACDTGNQQLCLLSKLKVDSNNCIIIHPVEEKILKGKDIAYMRMHAMHLIAEYILNMPSDMMQEVKKENIYKEIESLKKQWIKENL